MLDCITAFPTRSLPLHNVFASNTSASSCLHRPLPVYLSRYPSFRPLFSLLICYLTIRDFYVSTSLASLIVASLVPCLPNKELVGIRWNWLEFVGIGWNWLELVGFCATLHYLQPFRHCLTS